VTLESILDFLTGGWALSLLQAAGMTVAVAICGFFAGAVVGSFGALAKIAGGPVLRRLADGYTTVLRGIPDLLVIYLFYFGSSAILTPVGQFFGATGFISLPGFLAGALAIGVVSGAYQTEVLRGAYLAIPAGELEAAEAAGMPPFLRFRRIIAPLALRFAIPGIGNVWQLVLKETALISVTGLVELLRQAQIGAGSTRQPFLFFVAAACLYMLISACSSWGFGKAEHHFSRGLRRV
jgi:octopine/nopaline transport system permease protein